MQELQTLDDKRALQQHYLNKSKEYEDQINKSNAQLHRHGYKPDVSA